MRIFPITKRLRERRRKDKTLRPGRCLALRIFLGQIVGNRPVILRRATVHLGSQLPPQLQRGSALLLNLLGHRFVIQRVHHYRNALMILGRAAKHGRPTDVDIFDRFRQRHPFPGNRLLKGIKIDHHQINRLNIVLLDCRLMLFISANVKQTSMHLGMQRLDPSIQHLRKSSILTQLNHRNPVFFQYLGRSSGRNDLHSRLGQYTGKGKQTRLVED